MPLVIPVAHDFVCPWCWIGLRQVQRLRAEFGVEAEWLAYELFPEPGPFEGIPPTPVPSKRPKTPGRLALAYAAEGMEPPVARGPIQIRSQNAHQAVEFAKTEGVADALVEEIYKAYWTRGLDISNEGVLCQLAEGIVRDLAGLKLAIKEHRFADKIVGFDQAAYDAGVYNVPTFFIEGERYAEQPYRVLERALGKTKTGVTVAAVYEDLTFPAPPATRPYTYINMVSTIDGKTLSGERDEHVMDLGSKADHDAMRRLERAADAVFIGAGSLRATPNLWYPRELIRLVATRTGDLNFASRFFTDAPEQAFVVAPEGVAVDVPKGVRMLRYRHGLVEVLEKLRRVHNVEYLLAEGGSELNGHLIAEDIVDELFLTLAPKVKLGRDVPTYAGGDPLSRDQVKKYSLIGQQRVGDELFLRYRRNLSV